MNDDDKVLLAYVAGVLTVAVVIPAALLIAVQHIPAVQRALRRQIIMRVDSSVANARSRLTLELAAVDAGAEFATQATLHQSLAELVHTRVAPLVADAVFENLGAPPGAGRV